MLHKYMYLVFTTFIILHVMGLKVEKNISGIRLNHNMRVGKGIAVFVSGNALCVVCQQVHLRWSFGVELCGYTGCI